MAQVNFRIDDETKRRAESLFNSMGLTMSSAIMVFIRQSITDKAIPFKVSVKNATHHEKPQKAFDDWGNGRKNYHYHDLIEVDDDKSTPRAKDRRRRSCASCRTAHARLRDPKAVRRGDPPAVRPCAP